MDAAFTAGMTPSRRGRPKLDAPKVEVRIRLDAKIVAHPRGSSPGWQTRINALLDEWMASGRIQQAPGASVSPPGVRTGRVERGAYR